MRLSLAAALGRTQRSGCWAARKCGMHPHHPDALKKLRVRSNHPKGPRAEGKPVSHFTSG